MSLPIVAQRHSAEALREANDGLGEAKQAHYSTELSYVLAKCYLSAGQYPEAMEVFQSLLKRDRNSAAVGS